MRAEQTNIDESRLAVVYAYECLPVGYFSTGRSYLSIRSWLPRYLVAVTLASSHWLVLKKRSSRMCCETVSLDSNLLISEPVGSQSSYSLVNFIIQSGIICLDGTQGLDDLMAMVVFVEPSERFDSVQT